MPVTHASAAAAAMSDFSRGVEHLDSLVTRLEDGVDPAARATAQDLVQTVMALHRMALARLLEVLATHQGDLVAHVATDPMVSSLLVLHELHPVPLATRVERGVERARAALRAHGADLEFVGIDDEGNVSLRVPNHRHGGAESSWPVTRDTIEEALRELAPEIGTIEIAGVPLPPPTLAPSGNGASHRRAPLPLAPARAAGAER